ncbi:hypothetical protein VNO77_02319 [Canavalia gladiata]|uniref:Uncharacterized protein n=1 Tax=Canavalia gladiata TaxID=3824 RepID=A0AAN9RB61_CANGL
MITSLHLRAPILHGTESLAIILMGKRDLKPVAILHESKPILGLMSCRMMLALPSSLQWSHLHERELRSLGAEFLPPFLLACESLPEEENNVPLMSRERKELPSPRK